MSKKSVNNVVGILTKCLHTAHEWQVMDNPPPKVRKLKAPPPKFDYLKEHECEQLLSSQNDRMVSIMILTAINTGLRLGELSGLRWPDVNFATGVITVQRNVVRGMVGTPKSNRIRYVPMTVRLRETLEPMRQADGYVFFRRDIEGNEPITQRVAENIIGRACRAAGLRKIGWHVLRHTFASLLVQKGASLMMVKELLGHTTIDMTMRYAHLAPNHLMQAINLLGPQSTSTEIESPRHQTGTRQLQGPLNT